MPGAWTLRVVNNGPGTATNVTLTSAPRGSRRRCRRAAPGRRVPHRSGDQVRPGHARAGRLADRRRRPAPDRRRPAELTGTVSAAEPDVVPPNDTDQAAVIVGLATVDLTATAATHALPAGSATTITIKAVTRSRRPARNASVCVRVPKGLNIPRPAGATVRGDACAGASHGSPRVGAACSTSAPWHSACRAPAPSSSGHRARRRRADAPRAPRATHRPRPRPAAALHRLSTTPDPS